MTQIQFTATLIRPDGIGTWTYLDIPADHADFLGAKGQVRVAGTINKHPFRTSARPHGNGTHYIVVNKSIRDAIQVQAGDTVDVTMEKDNKPRVVDIPTELTNRLQEEQLESTFAALSYSHKKEYVDWISSAKKPETRQRRIEKSIIMLQEGSTPKSPKR